MPKAQPRTDGSGAPKRPQADAANQINIALHDRRAYPALR